MKAVATDRVRKRRPRGSDPYPIIPVRVPPEVVSAIDSWAVKADKTRSEAIRLLIEAGLKRRPKA